MSDGGKGSSPRPFSVNKETFDANWERIFQKNKQTIKETLIERIDYVDENVISDEKSSSVKLLID